MRVAVIGCGRHAMSSVYPALTPAGLELVATCAQHMENAQVAARRFGAEQAFDDPCRMLEGADPEGVVVPAGAYASLIHLCVAAGKPVFTEKPGAASSEEAASLARAAEEAGVGGR